MSAMEQMKQRQDAEAKRTPEVIYDEIVRKLSSIDGISTGDSMDLGRLVFEYGNRKAGDAMANVMGPLLDMVLAKKDGPPAPPKEPWQQDNAG